ncbi:MAG: signal peptidase II [Gammaproteobacteria bacterium]
MKILPSWLRRLRPESFVMPAHPPVRWLALALLVLIADQFTKLLTLYYLKPYVPMPLLPVLNLTLIYNRGAAFSLFGAANGWQQWLFVVLALAFSTAILVWLRRLPARGYAWLSAGLALILAGALGNAIDRVWHAHVIDFIQVHYDELWYFPTFNIADSAITVGAIIVIADALFRRRRSEPEKVKPESLSD